MASTVCATSLMCKKGRSAVEQMSHTFDYLRDNNQGFNAAAFEPTVRSIESEFNAIYSFYTEWIPFNPDCCTIEDIGINADAITNQMLASVGAAGVPPPPPQTDWGTVIIVGGVILLAVVYSPQVKRIIK